MGSLLFQMEERPSSLLSHYCTFNRECLFTCYPAPKGSRDSLLSSADYQSPRLPTRVNAGGWGTDFGIEEHLNGRNQYFVGLITNEDGDTNPPSLPSRKIRHFP